MLRWIISFLSIESALAVGALLGVAVLDVAWVGGLGMTNLQLVAGVGLLLSVILGIAVSLQKKVSFSIATVGLSLIAFFLSACMSHLLGVAMIGI